MKKILLSVLLFVTCNLNTYCQELNGIYKLAYPPADGSNITYLNFNKGNFIYFSLGSSVEIFDGTNELKEIGTGKYNFEKNKIILNFKTDTSLIPPYIYDSVLSSFSSIKNQNAINITVEFYNTFYQNFSASLIIETTTKEYVQNFKSGISKVVNLPQEAIIKSIKIASLGLPIKYLPFDINYNNLKYVIFAKDKKSGIKIIEDKILELEIKKYIGVDSIYIFGKHRYLKKADKRELEYLNILSNGAEPRLNKILNYHF